MADSSSPIFIQRTAILNGINSVGKLLRVVGFDPFTLDADSIIRNAKKKANFSADIPPQVVDGLHRAVRAIREEGNPNPFGALAVKTLFERTLYGRLKVEQTIQEDPSIRDQKIEQPVFIIGMPRTGTTILHAIMHEDRHNRSPLAWECLLPYPVPKVDTYNDNDQLNSVRKEFGQLFKLVPDFKMKHHMEADSPQECIGITALDFNTFQTTAQFYMPSYMDWFFDGSDHLATMRWHKRFLQYLQSGGVKGERWLLKTPVHMIRLKEIFEVYPDARIIMTHRDPIKVVPSAASLISSVRSLYSDSEDPVRSGNEQAEIWSKYFDRFLKDRKALDREDQFIDIRFEEFVADQIGCIRSIYKHFGFQADENAVTAMKRYLDSNPKDKHGAHKYTLQDFGLTEEGIRNKFANYYNFLENDLQK
ncbi:MAG: sulfotransferase [Chitinophagales bacterium]|nr:sulfotransferase [Chitinophagales bacterium]